MEALCDRHIARLIKVSMNKNPADLNSKLLSVVHFEYPMNKAMVHKELLALKAAASMKP